MFSFGLERGFSVWGWEMEGSERVSEFDEADVYVRSLDSLYLFWTRRENGTDAGDDGG